MGQPALEVSADTMLAPQAEKYRTTHQLLVFSTMFMAKQTRGPKFHFGQ